MRERDHDFPQIAAPEAVDTLRSWHCRYGNLGALRRLRNLRGLEIASYPDPTLDAIGELRMLRYLFLLHLPKVTSLGPLSRLTSLVTLRLHTLPSWDASRKRTVVESLEPVAHLKNLQHIELFGVSPADGSLRPLEDCKSLKTARFHLIPKVEVKRFYEVTGLSDAHSPAPDF